MTFFFVSASILFAGLALTISGVIVWHDNRQVRGRLRLLDRKQMAEIAARLVGPPRIDTLARYGAAPTVAAVPPPPKLRPYQPVDASTVMGQRAAEPVPDAERTVEDDEEYPRGKHRMTLGRRLPAARRRATRRAAAFLATTCPRDPYAIAAAAVRAQRIQDRRAQAAKLAAEVAATAPCNAPASDAFVRLAATTSGVVATPAASLRLAEGWTEVPAPDAPNYFTGEPLLNGVVVVRVGETRPVRTTPAEPELVGAVS